MNEIKELIKSFREDEYFDFVNLLKSISYKPVDYKSIKIQSKTHPVCYRM